jgi:hypothetical protein
MFKDREPVTVYTCTKGRIGDGIAVPVGKEPTELQIMMAKGMVADCEGSDETYEKVRFSKYGDCPPDCDLRMLAEERI